MEGRDPFDVAGKVIIVTGSGGFLGSGYVTHLREAGAHVIGWDSNTKDGAVDITDEQQVRRAVEHVMDSQGCIDGLVNNAAMNPAVGSNESKDLFRPYEEYDIDLFRKEVEVNLIGQMICIKHIAPVMMQQRFGSIVNVASGAAVDAHDHRVYDAGETKFKSPAYVASKTAVLGLTRQWAARLGAHNVRVNAISIGAVRNDGMPEGFVHRYGEKTMLRRLAEPGEYCATLQYLLSDASAYMTGTNLIIDGGKHAW